MLQSFVSPHGPLGPTPDEDNNVFPARTGPRFPSTPSTNVAKCGVWWSYSVRAPPTIGNHIVLYDARSGTRPRALRRCPRRRITTTAILPFSIDLYLLADKYTAPVRRLDNPAVSIKYNRDLNDWCVGRVTAMEYLFDSLSVQ
jgi:hypothetical protein